MFVQDVQDGDEDSIGMESYSEEFLDEGGTTAAAARSTPGYSPSILQRHANLGGAAAPTLTRNDMDSTLNTLSESDDSFHQRVESAQDVPTVWNSMSQNPPVSHPHYFGDDVSLVPSLQEPRPLDSMDWINDSAAGNRIVLDDDLDQTDSSEEDDMSDGNLDHQYGIDAFEDEAGNLINSISQPRKSKKTKRVSDKNGNSLPHPDALTSRNLANLHTDLMSLGGGGNSLPHPETLTGMSMKEETIVFDNSPRNNDAILDVHGNSLPHPDAMRSTNLANRDQDLIMLSGDGNSLPHPEAMLRKSKTKESKLFDNSSENDDAILDVHGNSLPHPDAMRSTNLANRDQDLIMLGGDGNSLPHPETILRKSKTKESKLFDNSRENDDAILDVHGNSLPHPDAMRSTNLANRDQDLIMLGGDGNSLPHPETILRKSKTKESNLFDNSSDNDDAILDSNGNSLPHPDALQSINRENQLEEEDLILLGGNGNSLPHPETMLRKSKTKESKLFDNSSDNDDGILDVNGNSLPHPDAMRLKNLTKKDNHDLDILAGNGNSLPHPETLRRRSKAAPNRVNNEDEQENDDAMLDIDGNSLPHPDAMHSRSVAIQREEDQDGLNDNGNSLPHPDALMRFSITDNNTHELLANIEAVTDEEDSDTEEGTDSSSSSSGSSTDGDDRLDDNGNSLPHPDTMMASELGSSERPSRISAFGLRLGNIRRSLLSSLSGTQKPPANSDIEALNRNGIDDGFVDETSTDHDTYETRPEFATAMAIAPDEDGDVSDLLHLGDNIDSPPEYDQSTSNRKREESSRQISLDDNGNSLPTPLDASIDRRPSASLNWRMLGQSVRATFGPATSSLQSNAASPREEGVSNHTNGLDPFLEDHDEEDGYVRTRSLQGADRSKDVIPFAYEVDAFDDENRENECKSSLSRKQRIKRALNERKFEWRCGCLIFGVTLVFLGLFIPLIMLAKERRQQVDEPISIPTAAPTEQGIIIDPNCKDEIFLMDESGNEITSTETDSFGSVDVPTCYTTTDRITYRYKRCNPSRSDWVGVFPDGSLFMDKLWRDYVAGVYLCEDQPCPSIDKNTPLFQTSKTPAIQNPGIYRMFLVEESEWPYSYLSYSVSFRVVPDGQSCDLDPSKNEPGPVENPNSLVGVGDGFGSIGGNDDASDQTGQGLGNLFVLPKEATVAPTVVTTTATTTATTMATTIRSTSTGTTFALVYRGSGNEAIAAAFTGVSNLLPEEKSRDASALYAWCRRLDEICDNEETSDQPHMVQDQLTSWQYRFDNLWTKQLPMKQDESSSNPLSNNEISVISSYESYSDDEYLMDLALRECIQRYQVTSGDDTCNLLTRKPFDDMIAGMRSDAVEDRRVQNMEELEFYAYQVAGTVGIMLLPLLLAEPTKCFDTETYRSVEEAKDPAISLGQGIQLVNILRDATQDAKLGRIYLPQDMLRKEGVSGEVQIDLLLSACLQMERPAPEGYKRVVRKVANRANELLAIAEAGRSTLPSPLGPLIVQIIIELYRDYLEELKRRGYDNLNIRGEGDRVRISTLRKIQASVRAMSKVFGT